MKEVLVWDWPIRLSHWLMVLLFTGLIVTGKLQGDYLQYHFYLGYSLSAVIIFRLIYGLYGSHHARFSQFIRGPKEVFEYFLGLLKRQPKTHMGHNPVGALMVILLLVLITLQWFAGLFTSDEVFWFGPLNQYANDHWISIMRDIHHTLPNILLLLVGLHTLAVLYHELCLKERLILAMIHGKKSSHHGHIEIKSPRWGVIFSMLVALAWLIWLWHLPL